MISHSRLCGVIDYNPNTGHFTWKRDVGMRARKGTIAGNIDIVHGYVRIGLENRLFLAHRLAWFYMTGAWPRDQIDHVNLIRHDNRWSNLREANKSQNLGNIRARCDNVSGYKGVCYHNASGAWMAQIMKDGKKVYLGLFGSPELAHKAYRKAAQKYFGKFARSG